MLGQALVTLLLVAIGSVLYFLPTIIGASRGIARVWTLFLVNLLIGWSLIGWFVALVMALRPGRARASRHPYGRGSVPPASGPPPGWYQDPGGSDGFRWWDGRAWTDHLRPPPV